MGNDSFSDLFQIMLGQIHVVDDEGRMDQAGKMMQWRAKADAHIQDCLRLQDRPDLIDAITIGLLDMLASPNDPLQVQPGSNYALRYGMTTERVPDLQRGNFEKLGYPNCQKLDR